MSWPFFHAKLLLVLSIYYFNDVFGREAMSVVKGIEFEAQKSRHVLHHKGRRRSALLDFDVMSFIARADGQTNDTRVRSYFSLTPSNKQLYYTKLLIQNSWCY